MERWHSICAVTVCCSPHAGNMQATYWQYARNMQVTCRQHADMKIMIGDVKINLPAEV